MKNNKAEAPLCYFKGAMNISHSLMKSTNVTQNLFGASPLTHGSHCRTYLCELQDSVPQNLECYAGLYVRF
jgi:hypothetical protein